MVGGYGWHDLHYVSGDDLPRVKTLAHLRHCFSCVVDTLFGHFALPSFASSMSYVLGRGL